MDIKFGKNIAAALGLGGNDETPVETTGDLSPRDAALQKKNKGHQAKFLPTGYARSVRRARSRARQTQLRKQAARQQRNVRQYEFELDTAGVLAGIYFGEVEANELQRRRITKRVTDQARNIAATEDDVTYAQALEQLETNLRNNRDKALELAKRREGDAAIRYLQSSRGIAALNRAEAKVDAATGHPVVG